MQQASPNQLKLCLIFSLISLIFMLIGNHLGERTGMGYGLVVSLPVNLGLYFFCDKLVLALFSAKKVSQIDCMPLYGVAAFLAERAKIDVPSLYLIDEESPNAFSLGKTPETSAIIVTQGLIKSFNQEELAGVLAHEFAHILNRDTQVTTVIISIGCAIALFFNLLQSLLIVGPKTQKGLTRKWGAIMSSLCAPLLAVLLHLFLNKNREFLADEEAVELCSNPNSLTDAFQKLEKTMQHTPLKKAAQYPFTASLFTINPLLNRQHSLMFSTHPALDERIEQLYLLEDE